MPSNRSYRPNPVQRNKWWRQYWFPSYAWWQVFPKISMNSKERRYPRQLFDLLGIREERSKILWNRPKKPMICVRCPNWGSRSIRNLMKSEPEWFRFLNWFLGPINRWKRAGRLISNCIENPFMILRIR